LITFITNSKNKLGSENLKDRLQEVIEISTELKILVGYFYFSGINELYETLRKLYKENKLSQEHIKILVGMFDDKDKNIENKDRFIRDLICSIQRHLIYSAETVFNKIQQGSNEDDIINMIAIKEKQIKFFIELLEKKIVVIKKTEQNNHSKLYLFKTREILTPYLLIIGSSNLTNLGLIGRSEYGYGDYIWQDELNIEIRGYGFEEVEKYFDDLWENAISLSEDDINKIKKIVLPTEKSITEGCCMIKVYEDSCLEILDDKKKGKS
jgi:HKD family nuclease